MLSHPDYSPNEVKLFEALGHSKYILNGVNPIALYDIAALKAFRENLQGQTIEALRRATKAIHGCKVYRMTPEFDNLLEFEEN